VILHLDVDLSESTKSK